LPSTTPDGRPDYLQQLLAIWEDPQVKNLARAWARDPYVAEDALQEAYYAMAQVKNPERIEDVRSYFCRVLVRKIGHLRGQLGADVVDDFTGLSDACQHKLGGEALPPPFDEAVNTKLLAQQWMQYLASRGAALLGEVPGRSSDPDRYRVVVVIAAVWMLRAIVRGDFRREDLNLTLRAAFREWFAADGVAANGIQQRLSRGRADISALLKTAISADDLRS
jgi:Sigma-70 region 2